VSGDPPALRALRDPGDAPLLARFYDELYLPAFAHQREPLEAWTRQLWGAAAAYELSIVLAGADLDDAARARLDGGIVSERYPSSACGFLTYLVVAPHARRAGLGRHLLDGARAALGPHTRAIFGEVANPALLSGAAHAAALARLTRFIRWGARVLDLAYVQPALGPGLTRDPSLLLIAVFSGAPPASLPGPLVAAFLDELYTATEGASPGFEVPAEIPLRGSSPIRDP
jgi:GNAT superfamily N-acetyltransferase